MVRRLKNVSRLFTSNLSKQTSALIVFAMNLFAKWLFY